MDETRIIQWLNTSIITQTSYHNHKETMAWVFTALYVPGILTLGSSLSDQSLECWATALIFRAPWLLSTAFVAKQLYLRSIAADTILALNQLVTSIVKIPKSYRKKKIPILMKANSGQNLFKTEFIVVDLKDRVCAQLFAQTSYFC